jgi:hypothetical protein
MAAKAKVILEGTETVSKAADKAAGSIHQLRTKVQDATQPMKDLARSARDLMAFGGLAAGAAALYRGLSDCEKAFEKLHPEVAKMPGSIKQFTETTNDLKVAIGGAISGGISPLRSALADLLKDWSDNIKAATDYKIAVANLDQYVGGSEIKKRLQESKSYTDQYSQQLYSLREQQFRSPEAIGEITQKMTQISYAQYAAAQRWSASMAQAKELITPKTQTAGGKPGGAAAAVATLVSWAMDNPLGDISGIQAQISGRPRWGGFIGDVTGMGQLPQMGGAAPAATGATDWFMEQRAGALGAASSERNPLAALSPLMDVLGVLGEQFSSISILMQPMQIILNSMMQVLQPVMDTVLAPLIGIFAILGNTLGQILVPVIQLLTPVIEAVGKGFVWLYNNVIRPVGNFLWATFTNLGSIISWVVNKIVALGTTIWYIVSFQWGKLGSVNWGGAMNPMVTPEQGPLAKIDLSSLSAAGAGYQSSQGGGAYSNTSVQKPPDIYVYVTYEGPIFGDGGEARAGGYIVDSIKAYLGTGARVTFLEN